MDPQLQYSVKCVVKEVTRRFKIKGENYNELCDSLYRQFDNGVKIFWKDNEDDDIIIETAQDLEEAVSNLVGEVLRVTIKAVQPKVTEVVSKDTLAQTDPQTTEAGIPFQKPIPLNERAAGPIHPAVCDLCDSAIIGHRFQCLMCFNFDLCQACESTGAHAQHAMMRIVSPDTTLIPWGAKLVQDATRVGNNIKESQQTMFADARFQKMTKNGLHFLAEVGSVVSDTLSSFGIDASYEVRSDKETSKPEQKKTAAPAAATPSAPPAAAEQPAAPQPSLLETKKVEKKVEKMEKKKEREEKKAIKKEEKAAKKSEAEEAKREKKEREVFELFSDEREQARIPRMTRKEKNEQFGKTIDDLRRYGDDLVDKKERTGDLQHKKMLELSALENTRPEHTGGYIRKKNSILSIEDSDDEATKTNRDRSPERFERPRQSYRDARFGEPRGNGIEERPPAFGFGRPRGFGASGDRETDLARDRLTASSKPREWIPNERPKPFGEETETFSLSDGPRKRFSGPGGFGSRGEAVSFEKRQDQMIREEHKKREEQMKREGNGFGYRGEPSKRFTAPSAPCRGNGSGGFASRPEEQPLGFHPDTSYKFGIPRSEYKRSTALGDRPFGFGYRSARERCQENNCPCSWEMDPARKEKARASMRYTPNADFGKSKFEDIPAEKPAMRDTLLGFGTRADFVSNNFVESDSDSSDEELPPNSFEDFPPVPETMVVTEAKIEAPSNSADFAVTTEGEAYPVGHGSFFGVSAEIVATSAKKMEEGHGSDAESIGSEVVAVADDVDSDGWIDASSQPLATHEVAPEEILAGASESLSATQIYPPLTVSDFVNEEMLANQVNVDETFANLITMGYTDQQARRAISHCGCDLINCVDYISQQ